MTIELGLVLIGPPGVGKGTQAARLREEFDLAHIATGDLLREHCARGTELGRQASERMAAGRLVPDDHCPHGHIFHIGHEPPRRERVCDHDGLPLERRDDDAPETVRRRLKIFHGSTGPVIAYYEWLGLLRRIDASRPATQVYADARRLLAAITGGG